MIYGLGLRMLKHKDLGSLVNSVPPHISGKPYGVYEDKLCSYVHDLRNAGLLGVSGRSLGLVPSRKKRSHWGAFGRMKKLQLLS